MANISINNARVEASALIQQIQMLLPEQADQMTETIRNLADWGVDNWSNLDRIVNIAARARKHQQDIQD